MVTVRWKICFHFSPFFSRPTRNISHRLGYKTICVVANWITTTVQHMIQTNQLIIFNTNQNLCVSAQPCECRSYFYCCPILTRRMFSHTIFTFSPLLSFILSTNANNCNEINRSPFLFVLIFGDFSKDILSSKHGDD